MTDLRGYYACHLCDVEPFFVKSLLDQHIRQHHPEETPGPPLNTSTPSDTNSTNSAPRSHASKRCKRRTSRSSASSAP